MQLEIILQILGGTAVLIAAVAWFLKTLITALLSKDLEKFKAELQLTSQKTLEEYKASLLKDSNRNSAEFSTLQSIRASTVANIFRQVVNICDILRSLNSARVTQARVSRSVAGTDDKYQLSTKASEIERDRQSLKTTCIALFQNYEESRIYLSTTLCLKIEAFIVIARSAGVSFIETGSESTGGAGNANLARSPTWDELFNEAWRLKWEVENEFRAILGAN